MQTDNSKSPLVSVIVPNYNYARYLPARLDSILGQTYSNIEVIMIDDASTDNSLEVMEAYARKDKRVACVVANDENSGTPFEQWMKGIKMAKGKYCWIAEADDVAEASLLETCVGLLERDADAAFCFCGSIIIDKDGRRINKDVNHWGKRSEGAKFKITPGEMYCETNLYWKNYVMNASAVVFSRQRAMECIRPEYASYRYCGDWMFWFDMASKGDVIEAYECLNSFRQHGDKVTTKSRATNAGVNEDIRIVKYMESKLPLISPYKKRVRRGLLYSKIKRKVDSPRLRRESFALMSNLLGAHKSQYALSRVNKLLGLLSIRFPTPKNERQ